MTQVQIQSSSSLSTSQLSPGTKMNMLYTLSHNFWCSMSSLRGKKTASKGRESKLKRAIWARTPTSPRNPSANSEAFPPRHCGIHKCNRCWELLELLDFCSVSYLNAMLSRVTPGRKVTWPIFPEYFESGWNLMWTQGRRLLFLTRAEEGLCL